MSILIFLEHDADGIKDGSLAAVTAAKAIGGDITAIVVGEGADAAADAAAKIDGISAVVKAGDDAYSNAIAENIAPLLVEAAAGKTHLIAAATTVGKNILPRAAALMDVQPISDISAVIDAETFERPIYAGNAIATVKSSDSIKVLTVRTANFDAAAAEGGSASVSDMAGAGAAGMTAWVADELSASDRPELTSASVVVSGGRGMGSADNFVILDALADKLGAAVGASRAAVDAGFAPNDYQVGQTGKVVSPDLYIAVGISGAIQHLAGMKDSKVIVAINKDEEAPIFQVADYGLVADLFDAVPELTTGI